VYRVVVSCTGVSPQAGAEAARDIEREFNHVRTPRYANAVCTFAEGNLTLACDNDGWDMNGLNLMDEFSDCLTAFVMSWDVQDGNMRLVSVTAL
jgi:hypothetical protein